MLAQTKTPAGQGEGKETQPAKTRALSQHPSTLGLHRLYQQACRCAVNASQRGDYRMADAFGAVAYRLEWLLGVKGEAV